MNYSLCRAGALVALMSAAFATGAHAAPQAQRLSNPGDIDAPVPPTYYKPLVFLPTGSSDTPSPADTWKASNRVVASYDSMALTMDAPTPTPADEKAAAQPDPHAHHQPKAVK